MKVKDVDKMKPQHIKQYLKELIQALDELDGNDFFGTEGWRKFLMGEDS